MGNLDFIGFFLQSMIGTGYTINSKGTQFTEAANRRVDNTLLNYLLRPDLQNHTLETSFQKGCQIEITAL